MESGDGFTPPVRQAAHLFYRRALTRLDVGRRAAESLPPSFFIVGAPRCGTTSLSKALKRHPQISFSKPKETHFLLLAPAELSEAELRALYVDLHHPDLCPWHRAIGDGSVSYLYAPDTIRRALRFDQRARFIAMVRSPLDMLLSYHARLVFTLQEDVGDFAQAWELQSRRAAGEKIPKRCTNPRLLQYGEVGMLGAHIEQLFAVAGRERCLVILFDDLDHDPRAVYPAGSGVHRGR
jgi:Sulfotransferase family